MSRDECGFQGFALLQRTQQGDACGQKRWLLVLGAPEFFFRPLEAETGDLEAQGPIGSGIDLPCGRGRLEDILAHPHFLGPLAGEKQRKHVA